MDLWTIVCVDRGELFPLLPGFIQSYANCLLAPAPFVRHRPESGIDLFISCFRLSAREVHENKTDFTKMHLLHTSVISSWMYHIYVMVNSTKIMSKGLVSNRNYTLFFSRPCVYSNSEHKHYNVPSKTFPNTILSIKTSGGEREI